MNGKEFEQLLLEKENKDLDFKSELPDPVEDDSFLLSGTCDSADCS